MVFQDVAWFLHQILLHEKIVGDTWRVTRPLDYMYLEKHSANMPWFPSSMLTPSYSNAWATKVCVSVAITICTSYTIT